MISVVTPVKNALCYVEQYCASFETLETFPSELLIIDDSSSDMSATLIYERLSRTLPTAVKLLQSDGLGVSAARNSGLRRARGPFVAFLDVDDSWTPNRLTLLARELSAFDHRLLHSPRAASIAASDSSTETQISCLVRGSCVVGGSASGAVVHLDACLEVGGFDESLAYAEDYDLWLRYIRRNGARTFAPGSVRLGLVGIHQSLPAVERTRKDLESRVVVLTKFLASYPNEAPAEISAAAQEHVLKLLVVHLLQLIRARKVASVSATSRKCIRVLLFGSPKVLLRLPVSCFRAFVWCFAELRVSLER